MLTAQLPQAGRTVWWHMSADDCADNTVWYLIGGVIGPEICNYLDSWTEWAKGGDWVVNVCLQSRLHTHFVMI